MLIKISEIGAVAQLMPRTLLNTQADQLLRRIMHLRYIYFRFYIHDTYGLNSNIISFYKMTCSTVRYGPGVTREVGMDMANLKAKKVCVVTDPNIAKLPPLQATMDSLSNAGVKFEVFDKVRVEPTDGRQGL